MNSPPSRDDLYAPADTGPVSLTTMGGCVRRTYCQNGVQRLGPTRLRVDSRLSAGVCRARRVRNHGDVTPIRYREFAPPPGLEALVACVWVSHDGEVRVLPDACVDVVLTGGRLVVAGPATAATLAPATPGQSRVGVRFRVGAAGTALGVPAGELRDQGVPLAELWGADARRLEDRVVAAEDPRAALLALIGGVAQRLPAPEDADHEVRRAALALARPVTGQDDAATVAASARAAGLSERRAAPPLRARRRLRPGDPRPCPALPALPAPRQRPGHRRRAARPPRRRGRLCRPGPPRPRVPPPRRPPALSAPCHRRHARRRAAASLTLAPRVGLFGATTSRPRGPLAWPGPARCGPVERDHIAPNRPTSHPRWPIRSSCPPARCATLHP